MKCTYCHQPLIQKEGLLSDHMFYACPEMGGWGNDWYHSFIYIKNNIFRYFSFVFEEYPNYALVSSQLSNDNNYLQTQKIWLEKFNQDKEKPEAFIHTSFQTLSSIPQAQKLFERLYNLIPFS